MKSNVCKIDKGKRDLVAVFKEAERVAEYNHLTHKQSLQLRLICEELDGMLPHIVESFRGELWIDYEDGVCKVNASIEIPEINSDKKKALIAVSSDGKNASAVGIVGKIRNVIENYLLNEESYANSFVSTPGVFRTSTGYSEYTGYSHAWSLGEYKDTVKKEKKTEAWDELERSVIASVADDVIVGVKGSRAEIVIVKKFK